MGLISHRDLLHAAMSSVAAAPEIERSRHLSDVPIVKVMQTDVQTIGPDDSIRKAALLMRQAKIGCLPVVSDGKLVGILTGFDLVGIVEKL